MQTESFLGPRGEWIGLLCLLIGGVAVLSFSAIGYYGGDDREYFLAARQWIDDFPPLGRTHWSLRYPIVLPLALYQKLVGSNELALMLVCLVYGVGVLSITYAIVRTIFGPLAALLGTAILVTNPVFAVGVVCLFSDVPELFFAAASIGLYLWNFQLRATPDARVSALLGLTLGLAFMVRETSIVLVVFLFGAVLLHRAYRHFLYMGFFGFAPINLAAVIYQWHKSGLFFYRLSVSSRHDTIDRSNLITTVAASGDFIDWNGTISVNVLADPFILLLANHKIGLIFWVLIAGLLALFVRLIKLSPPQRRVVLVLALALVSWVLFVTLAGNVLWLVARYILVPIWLACMLVGAIAAPCLLAGARLRLIAAALLLGLIGSNLGLLALEHKEPMVTERRLSDFVVAEVGGSRVYSDPTTASNTNLLLVFANSPARILARSEKTNFSSADAPRPGDLVAVSHKFLRMCRERRPSATDADCIQDTLGTKADPTPWRQVAHWEFELPSLLLKLDRLGLLRQVPYGVARRLMRPDDRMTVYKIAG